MSSYCTRKYWCRESTSHRNMCGIFRYSGALSDTYEHCRSAQVQHEMKDEQYPHDKDFLVFLELPGKL